MPESPPEEYFARQEDHASVEARVLRLEWTVNLQAEAIHRLEASASSIASDIRVIQDTLKQIKYVSMGAGLIVASSELGLSAVIKGLLL